MSQRLEKATILDQGSRLDKINRKFFTPPPGIKDGKNGALWLLRGFIFDFGGGGWGFAVPFLSVQDCSPWAHKKILRGGNIKTKSAAVVFFFLLFLSFSSLFLFSLSLFFSRRIFGLILPSAFGLFLSQKTAIFVRYVF